MKTLLWMPACAALVICASGSAFAADGSVSVNSHSSVLEHAAATRQTSDALGTWPHRWAKDDETAATDALNALEVHDYAQFSNFHKKGDAFEATVMLGGKPVQVLVDPARGTVTPEG
jgi:hypothetical protein